MNYKIYAEVLEDEALKQFQEAMKQPGVIQGALMPDAHTGYVLPIGAVVKTKNYVYPSWVGYDIGCGVIAYKTDIHKEKLDLEKTKENILKNIPIGFNIHKSSQAKHTNLRPQQYSKFLQDIYSTKGVYQLGTLGGGNHFIELGYDSKDYVWIIIHSGSRGFGKTIAEHYMKLAMNKNTKIFDDIHYIKDFEQRNKTFKEKNPEGYQKALDKYIFKQQEKELKNINVEGHYGFEVYSDEGMQYLYDLDFTLNYALENRKLMAHRVAESLVCIDGAGIGIEFVTNRNHNHAEIKDGYIIHRKGATHAEDGMIGVIPGNMKDGSFIVKGKGNITSICSSSHGAGRVLSRSQAKKTLLLADLYEDMENIVTNHSDATLDEAPKAYKNIFEVMKLQEDLVEVIEHIKPLLNIKG